MSTKDQAITLPPPFNPSVSFVPKMRGSTLSQGFVPTPVPKTP